MWLTRRSNHRCARSRTCRRDADTDRSCSYRRRRHPCWTGPVDPEDLLWPAQHNTKVKILAASSPLLSFSVRLAPQSDCATIPDIYRWNWRFGCTWATLCRKEPAGVRRRARGRWVRKRRRSSGERREPWRRRHPLERRKNNRSIPAGQERQAWKKKKKKKTERMRRERDITTTGSHIL